MRCGKTKVLLRELKSELCRTIGPLTLHSQEILRILAMHNYLGDTLLFQAKNKALALKFAHSVVHLSVLEPKKLSFLTNFRAMHS